MHIHIHVYIYIYTHTYKHSATAMSTRPIIRTSASAWPPTFGWPYLSIATCLMRPRLFYALFVVSRITMICYILHHF